MMSLPKSHVVMFCSNDEHGAMPLCLGQWQSHPQGRRRPCGFARLWWGPAGFCCIAFIAIVSPKPGGHFPPAGGRRWLGQYNGPIFHVHRPLLILRAHKNTSPHGRDVLPTGEEVKAEGQTHTYTNILRSKYLITKS